MGYPLTPMLFAAVTLWAVISSIFRSPEVAMPGLLSMIAGVPAYFFVRRFVSTGQ